MALIFAISAARSASVDSRGLKSSIFISFVFIPILSLKSEFLSNRK